VPLDFIRTVVRIHALGILFFRLIGDGYEDASAFTIHGSCSGHPTLDACGSAGCQSANRARQLRPFSRKSEGAHLVPGRKVRDVHSLGSVQRVLRWRMEYGDAAYQSNGIREVAGIF